MPDRKPLRVLSIAHAAVTRNMGRLRYHAFASMPEFNVHVLAPSQWREYGRVTLADPAADPGVTMHIEPIRLNYTPGMNWYLHYYPRLPEIVSKLMPDVIHLWEEPWSIVACHALRHLNGAGLVIETDQNILKTLPPPFEYMRQKVLGRTNVLLSRSPDATEVSMARGYSGPVVPIGYGVDEQTYYVKPGVDTGDPSGRPLRLSYAGRLVEEKGLSDLLKAMKLASAPIHLTLMGEGVYEPQLREQIRALELQDQVSIRGWGSASDVADVFRDSDLSVLLTYATPTMKEQFGRAIMESQACGVPVIGSTCGAIPDVVADGGWIVPYREPKTLAVLLDRLSSAPDELARCARAGIANVAARFTYQKVAEALARSWREAAAQTQRNSSI